MMSQGRHSAQLSHNLPPTPQETSFATQKVRLNLRSHNKWASGPILPNQHSFSNEETVNVVAMQAASRPTSLEAHSATTNQKLTTICLDDELSTYKLHEFETVNRIIELCFQKSKRYRDPSSDLNSMNGPASINEDSAQTTLNSNFESAIVDKLTLIKCYEQTLKNQGLAPVEDSRIYKLLFRVIHEGELYLENNKKFMKCKEMARMERMSLLQNQLEQLKNKISQKDHNIEPRQHQISNQTLNTAQINQDCQFDSIATHLLNTEAEKLPMKSHPLLQIQEIETISQINGAMDQFRGFQLGITDPTPVNYKHVSEIGISEDADPNKTDTQVTSLKKITKLGLSSKFNSQADVSPNPVSDRQIDQEICDQHLNVGVYDTMDKPMISDKMSEPYVDNAAKTLTNEAYNDYDNEAFSRRPTVDVQTVSSDAFIMTTDDTRKAIQRERAPGHVSSAYVNTTCEIIQEEQQRSRMTQLAHDPSIIRVKPKSLSFCQDKSVSNEISSNDNYGMANKTVTYSRNGSSQNKTAYVAPQETTQSKNNRYALVKPPVEPKKVLSFKLKVDYSFVFKVFRAWKDHQTLRKRQKKLKKLLLNGLVKAINKHEQLLTIKTFRALRMCKFLNKKLQKRHDHVQRLVNHNTKAFYFRLMIKKYTERKFSSNLNGLAASHFRSGLRERIFQSWRIMAHLRREKLLKMVSMIKRKPQSAIMLIKFLGFSVMPTSQQNSFDILDFYSYCSIKKRFSPQQKRLSKTIELALKQQLRRILTGWIQHKNQIVNLKKQVRLNAMRRVFKALDKNCSLNYRLRLFTQRKQGQMQEQVILALLQNLERVRRLSISTQLVQNLHYGSQMRQFFSYWRELYCFYRVGSVMKFSQKSTPLKVLHLHKKRVFTRLRRYCVKKKEQRQLIVSQRQRHLVRLVQFAVKAWRQNSGKKCQLGIISQKIGLKVDARLRQVYFKGMIRACMLRQRQRAYREYVLMAKGLQGLAQRVDYRRMQNNMVQICQQTYLLNLTKRTFLALKSRKFMKETKHYMLIRARQFLAARSIQVIYKAWQEAILQMKQRKQLASEVDKYYNKKVYRRIFNSFAQYSHHRTVLSSIGSEIKRRQHEKIYRRVLIIMICKYAKRVNLRTNLQNFKENRKLKSQQKHFLFWIHKYRDFKAREHHLTVKHCSIVKQNIFYSWFQKSKQEHQHKLKIVKALSHTTFLTKANVFRELRKYALNKIESRKMKAVSSYFFICKVLRKTILALRMHAIQSKFQGANRGSQSASELIQAAFLALKDNWSLKRRIKLFHAQKMQKRTHQALLDWNNEAQRNKYYNLVLKATEQKRAVRNARLFFDLMRSVDSEQLKSYKLRKIWLAWKRSFTRIKVLQQKREQVAFVHSQMIKHCTLRDWRQAMFAQFALNKIALPYERTISMKRAFLALKKVTVRNRKAHLYYRKSLLFRSMQALTIHQMNEEKVKSMQQQINQRKLALFFDAFIDQCLIEQDLRVKAQELKQKTDSLLRERSYRHWFVLSQEKLHLEPIESAIKNNIREKWLLKVTFSAMCRYQQIRSGKKQMYESILNYQRQKAVEKAFNKIVQFTEKRALIRDMKHDAVLLRRKHVFSRLFRVSNHIREVEEAAADEQREKYLAYRAVLAFKSYIQTRRAKQEKSGKANVFYSIRLKLSVLRALALHTLDMEKKRLLAQSRQSITLPINSATTLKLSQNLRNQRFRSLPKHKLTLKKAIQKQRKVEIAVNREITDYKFVKKLFSLLKTLNSVNCRQTNHKIKLTSLRNRKVLRLASDANKKRTPVFKKSTSPRMLDIKTTFTTQKEEQLLEIMEVMEFQEETQLQSMEDSDEVLTKSVKVPERVKADKAARPMMRQSFEPEYVTAPAAQAYDQVNRVSINQRLSWQHQPTEHLQDIYDLRRDDQSSDESEKIGIEDCYQEDAHIEEDVHIEERKDTANFDESKFCTAQGQNEHIGAHLDKVYNQNRDSHEGVEIEDPSQSLQFVEDKWDQFFKKEDGGQGRQEKANNEDDQLHTMPSFRDGENECEKTLSIIYDEEDLARDHTASFSMQNQFLNQSTRPMSPAINETKSPAESIQVTAEPPKRVMKHMIAPESPLFQTKMAGLPPARPLANCLQASNQEIEDEMALYSSVQTYDHHQKHSSVKKSQGNDWLKKTLEKRLHANNNSVQNSVHRSSSWKPSQTLNSSIFSGEESFRGSTQTRVTASVKGKDNRIMQKIVENLNYLNLSRQDF